MKDLKHRLQRGARLITLLDLRRELAGDGNLGSNIERMIIDRELRDLADQIRKEPGPLAPHLARVHQPLRKSHPEWPWGKL